jgi:hypothetical protein
MRQKKASWMNRLLQHGGVGSFWRLTETFQSPRQRKMITRLRLRNAKRMVGNPENGL